jgi:HAD superfamily hydrolase (TIGR01549 family)
MTKINAILFDMGGPLVDDDDAQWAWFHRLQNLIIEWTGRIITDAEIIAALQEGVRCYAPSIINFVNWQICRPDKELYDRIRVECRKFPFEDHFILRPESRPVLEQLYGRFKLGIAANQRATLSAYLERENLKKYFDSYLASENFGFSKPDPRLFLKVLETLGVTPEEALMVGDRQDNDIVPARIIGMNTVRLRVGFHRNQVVRYPHEEPHFIIDHLSQLLDIPLICNRLNSFQE